MIDSVPCKVCGKPTTMCGTKLCNSCWEIIHRVAQIEPRLIVELLIRADKLRPVLEWCESNVRHKIVWGL